MTILEVAVVCKSNSGGFSITAFYLPNNWHLVYSLHILALSWAGSELSNRTMVAWPTSQLCVLLVASWFYSGLLFYLCPHGDSSAHLRLFLSQGMKSHRIFPAWLIGWSALYLPIRRRWRTVVHKILSQEMPLYFFISSLLPSLIFTYYCWNFSIALQLLPFTCEAKLKLITISVILN